MRISDWSSDVCSSDLRSFIEGVEENSDAVAVIEAVVTLGRRLGLEIVVEGIENEAQAKLMKEVGCTYLKGWFVDRPLGSSGVGRLLVTSSRVVPNVWMPRGSAACPRSRRARLRSRSAGGGVKSDENKSQLQSL